MKTYKFEAMTQRKIIESKVEANNEYEAIGIIYEYFQTENGKLPTKKLNKRYVKINWIKEI